MCNSTLTLHFTVYSLPSTSTLYTLQLTVYPLPLHSTLYTCLSEPGVQTESCVSHAVNDHGTVGHSQL